MQFALIPADLTPETVLDALRSYVGAANGISAADLVASITGRRSAADERRLRQVVEALRIAGHRVCADPAHGYHLAANGDELDKTCLFLHARAMTSITQIAAMKRVQVPELRGQLRLPMTAQEKPDATERHEPDHE
jgi:hypothetical protein